MKETKIREGRIMKLKGTMALLLIFSAFFALFGCSSKCAQKDDAAVVLTIENTVQDRITALSVEWADPSHTISQTDIELAGNEAYLRTGDFTFRLPEKQAESEELLKDLTVTIDIKDDNGSEIQTVSVLTLSPAYGSQYNYLLTYENGVYKISGK